MLVQAYQELLQRGYQDIELVLAGSDSPNSAGYMAGVAAAYADVPGLVLTGYVAEADVAPLFSSSAVVAFPYTSTTGSSGVLHQAGEYGRAAVLPRIGDLIDIIEEEGFRGVYFEPGDPISLADALAKVLDDDSLRDDLGRRNFAAASGIPMSVLQGAPRRRGAGKLCVGDGVEGGCRESGVTAADVVCAGG